VVEKDVVLFDLDNTLYASDTGILEQMLNRHEAYICRVLNLNEQQAAEKRRDLYLKYGTTMYGMIKHHDICPQDYMEFVYDVDVTSLNPCRITKQYVESLPGRKFVFTNASATHARRVLEQMDMADSFEDIFDTEWADFIPKPQVEPYHKLLAHLGQGGDTCAMFEDSPQNLEPAHALGMQTILVGNTSVDAPYIHHTAESLVQWAQETSQTVKEQVA